MINAFDQKVIFTRWEHPNNARYYEARIEHDLLGDIVLGKVWGNKHSGLGGNSQNVFTFYEAALKQLIALHQQRLKRGYRLIQQIGINIQ
jgi:predicted DNA-binding WGR domain protein